MTDNSKIVISELSFGLVFPFLEKSELFGMRMGWLGRTRLANIHVSFPKASILPLERHHEIRFAVTGWLGVGASVFAG